MTRAIVTVTADNADVWRSDAGLVMTRPGQPVVLLAGDVDDLHRLIARLDEALAGCYVTPEHVTAYIEGRTFDPVIGAGSFLTHGKDGDS